MSKSPITSKQRIAAEKYKAVLNANEQANKIVNRERGHAGYTNSKTDKGHADLAGDNTSIMDYCRRNPIKRY